MQSCAEMRSAVLEVVAANVLGRGVLTLPYLNFYLPLKHSLMGAKCDAALERLRAHLHGLPPSTMFFFFFPLFRRNWVVEQVTRAGEVTVKQQPLTP